MESSKHNWVNPETIKIQCVCSDCILDTILDLQLLRWYLGYKPSDTISFSSNSLGVIPDSVTDSSVLSNPADAQNVSCLGLCDRDICPKNSA